MLEPLDHALTAALRNHDMKEFDRLSHLADQQQAARTRRLAAPDALGNAARWYASQGIPVFPLQPGSKQPYPGSRGFKDATTDPARVAAWWTGRPDSNIGVPTGVRFDVVDVDGPAGFHSLGLLRDAGTLPAAIGKVRTPGWPNNPDPAKRRPVGMHYLIPPTGDGNSTKFAPGLDYRGAGGYIVAAPSVGPSGDRYDWIEPIALVTA